MADFQFDLTDGISVVVKHFSPLAVGSDVHRVIYNIRESSTGRLHKYYEVWLSREYVEDKRGLSSATLVDILAFANGYLKKRFISSGGVIPDEGGAFLTNELGESLGNPRTFPLKLKDDKRPNYVTTSMRLPEETHQWLVDYGRTQKVGLGEAIRRLVGDYAAGTASVGGGEAKSG